MRPFIDISLKDADGMMRLYNGSISQESVSTYIYTVHDILAATFGLMDLDSGIQGGFVTWPQGKFHLIC